MRHADGVTLRPRAVSSSSQLTATFSTRHLGDGGRLEPWALVADRRGAGRDGRRIDVERDRARGSSASTMWAGACIQPTRAARQARSTLEKVRVMTTFRAPRRRARLPASIVVAADDIRHRPHRGPGATCFGSPACRRRTSLTPGDAGRRIAGMLRRDEDDLRRR